MNDLVSRQAVRDIYIQKMAPLPSEKADWETLFGLLSEALREAPAEVPTSRRGHWVKRKEDALVHWDCSECGIGYLDDVGLDKLHFCPNCGARMDAAGRREKAYIAGKMTGDETYREKFAEAEERLRERGYVVLNPAVQPDGLTQAEYMRVALNLVDMADIAFFLPDWEQSEGAKVERAYCLKVGKPVAEFPAEG